MSDPNETIQVGRVQFSHQDLFNVVDKFYSKIAVDPILKAPFASVADWPEHIERLTHFWWIRFGGQPYMFNHYNPVAKHFFAGFNEELLGRWLMIFYETLDAELQPEQAQLWKNISERMGEALLHKNEMFREEFEGKS